MFQPLNPAIINQLDLKIRQNFDRPAIIDFYNDIKKRYCRTGEGCGLLANGHLWYDLNLAKAAWFDLTFEENK